MERTAEEIYKLDCDLRTSNLDIILADAVTAIIRTRIKNSSCNDDEILTGFYKFMSEVLVKAIGIEKNLVDEIVFRLLRQLSSALGVEWQECKNIFAEKNILIDKVSAIKHIEAIMFIVNQLEVNSDYDIPYLAGYSVDNPKKVYLDRGLKANAEITQNMYYALAIHEFTEKTLMNELKNMPYLYFRTHQIAQRTEKDVVESFGYAWIVYQDDLMAKEIERAYANTPTKIPLGLDYTPYIDCKDYNLISKMKNV
jgi:hypothetical protein